MELVIILSFFSIMIPYLFVDLAEHPEDSAFSYIGRNLNYAYKTIVSTSDKALDRLIHTFIELVGIITGKIK